MYPYNLPQPIPMERRWKPNVETAPNCPRCDSPNTKFCYYNNYSLTQPRYFCKACRRYWTKGGSLRNVPVGGGCRKNRRAKLSSKASSTGTTHFSRKTDGNCDGNNNGNGLYRPDLALDGMIGKCGTIDQKSSSIDLAAVYSKFVNPDMQVSYEMGSSSSSDQVNLSLASELENYSFDVYDNQVLAFMEGEGELVSDFAWQEEEHKYHQGVSSELFSVLSAAHLHPH